MDNIFTFLILIGIANVIIKWVRKQAANNQKNGGAEPEKPWQRMLGDMAKTMEATMAGKQTAGTGPAEPVYKTLKAPMSNGGGTDSGTAGSFTSGLDYQRPASIMDSIDVPSTEGTSKPLEPLPHWHGSLPGTEGSVALTANLNETPVMERAQETYPALNLQLNRNSLVQAVVMQEILTRPQDRRRRWRPH